MSKAGVVKTGLGDYSSVDVRVVYASLLATVLGAVASVAAWALLRLIDLATNLFYFGRFRFAPVSPSDSGVHWWSAFIPVLGGLVVGVIARYGSPKVRGHGLPEAIETVVFNGGKVQPRVALLKPLATAIAIGSGGPFGAEGPVIITGGAIGSVLGQFLPISDTERTILMVSGAAAGMAATFNCPMSAILLAVEILLFEWRPRSLIPVSIACVTAGAVRHLLLGASPIFQMPPTTTVMDHSAMLGALAVGLVGAFMAVGLSKAIHFFEGMFARLEGLGIHWMWWPALGGVGIGLCGLVFPQGLGVGYPVITQMVNETGITWKLLAGVLIVKTFMWTFSLGSETAGGLLAPLLMIGGAMGLAMGHFLPFISPGAWAVVGMTAVLTAGIGAPLTAAMLAVELTHNGGLMLPVLLACVTAYGISILISPRSMLTENLSRRGLHLSREYGVDPLELMLVSGAMHTSVLALPANATRKDAADWLRGMEAMGGNAWSHWQRVFPLVDDEQKLVGMLTRARMILSAREGDQTRALVDDAQPEPVSLDAGMTLRQAALVMATSGHTAFPVVALDGKLAGVITISDLLTARTKASARESDRVRVLRVHWPFGRRKEAVMAAVAATADDRSPSIEVATEEQQVEPE